MSKPPAALVTRVANVLAAAPSGIGDYDLAELVLEAILVDPLVVRALRDGRYAIDWPDTPAPHESRVVAISRDLLDRIVDRTADLVAGVRQIRADLDRIEGEVAALRNGPGVALVEPIPETTTAPTEPIALSSPTVALDLTVLGPDGTEVPAQIVDGQLSYTPRVPGPYRVVERPGPLLSKWCDEDRHADCTWPPCRCGCHLPTGIDR